MDKLTETQLLAYLKSQSRNKIVLYSDTPMDFNVIDVGSVLAQAIYNLKDESKLPMRVTAELDVILNEAITDHKSYGRMLAIANLGILLESDLKQDINRLFEKYSNNNVLFVKWEGETDNENLYFLSKENGIKININNLSHIAI